MSMLKRRTRAILKHNSGWARGLAAALALALASPAVSAETVVVMIDHAKIVRLPEKAQTVIVGNPAIADVTVQKNGILVVTGKSYGVTNLLALDPGGNMIAESLIRVQAPSEAVVTVQRGLERESYSCSPTCQPSMIMGDAKGYFSGVGDQAGQRNNLATSR
jgi:Flp pilus assembly secretin CpaC